MATSSAVCVVCGKAGSDGKPRKSGFKCRTCIGKSSDEPLKVLADKADEWNELIETVGYSSGQPVCFEEGKCEGTVANIPASVALQNDTLAAHTTIGWWPQSSPTVTVNTEIGPCPVPTSDLRFIVKTSVSFNDKRRKGYKVTVTAGKGEILLETFVKGSGNLPKKKVKKVTVILEEPALTFPELGTTSKTWLPQCNAGWDSAYTVLWRLRQIFMASGVEHNLTKPVTELVAMERSRWLQALPKSISMKQQQQPEPDDDDEDMGA